MSTTTPSRRLKNFALAVRSLFWVVLSAWLLISIGWIALHGVIVPRIGEFRPWLEQRAALALGVPVRIGTITAKSASLMPTVELGDVTLTDAQGREALRLPKVVVSLSPRALWNRGFEQLVIEAPSLDVRRHRDGRILVGGIDLSKGEGNDTAAADWFFSQGEFVIRHGTLRWTDEQRGAPPLTLSEVDLVVRNSLRQHQMRIDATPPPDWGQRFTLMGQFTQPLLTTHTGRWREWRGQTYADLPAVDVSQLRQYADLGLDLRSGRGAVRAWADVRKAVVTGGVADVALENVDVRLGRKLEPLELPSVAGRLGGERQANGFKAFTRGLQFRTGDGLQWPGGNVALSYADAADGEPAHGDFTGDRLDLAAVADIARRLPLGTATHAAITAYAPAGLLETVKAQWRGPTDALESYQASGRLSGLALAPAAAPPNPAAASPDFGRPGLSGATLDFDFDQHGGKAKLAMAGGWLEFPGVFETPRIPLDRLAGDLRWKLKDDRIEVETGPLAFSSADAQGEVQARWHTTDPADQPRAGRFPGVLDLHGSMSRADGTRVWRYLPQTIAKHVRDYVQQAVQKGRADGATFRVKGNLHDMPFRDAAQGQFRIAANVHDVDFDYIPPVVTAGAASAVRWPSLTQVSGELVFDGPGMAFNKARGRFAAGPRVELTQVDGRIPDMGRNATLALSAAATGPAGDLVALLRNSPVNAMTGQVLAKATATGNADYKLKLAVPLAAAHDTQVSGSVQFAGNDVQMSPEAPLLGKVVGRLDFSESGFSVPGAQARMLGGDVRFEGGMAPATAKPGPGVEPGLVSFKGQGTATAEGLRAASELGLVARLAQNFQGSAPYSVNLAFRRGKAEIAVTSSLVGMASNLPAPLNKAAETALPLRFDNSLLRESMSPGSALQDRLLVELDKVATVEYLRDVSGPEPRVLRGRLAVGLNPGESPAQQEGAVVANVRLDTLDLGAWEKALGSGTTSAIAQQAAQAPAGPNGYVPDVVALRAKTLRAEGHELGNVVIGGSRDGNTWRASVDADELGGYVEYRQPAGRGAGRLFARLARLTIAPGHARDVEQILDQPPDSIPALDVIVDDFDLRGRKLGRVEIDAVNRGPGLVAREGGVREWRLNKLNVTLPEASFSATGNWAAQEGQPAGAKRHTQMKFKLDIADSGKLLERFGMPGVVRRGKGRFEGQVGWVGSPLGIDYPTLSGEFNVHVEAGQFLKAEPGLAKLLGVLSLQSLPRRLALDFRDVFSEGFAFDFVRGDVNITQGLAHTNNLQMKGVNAAVLMEGQADIDKETQDIKVVVIPEINAGTASLVAAVINPAVGIGTFLAQMFLRQPLMESATQEFHIDGTWSDPRVNRVERRTQAAPPPAQ